MPGFDVVSQHQVSNLQKSAAGGALVMTDRVLKVLADSDACSKALDVGGAIELRRATTRAGESFGWMLVPRV